jgi:TatD DNase family protein
VQEVIKQIDLAHIVLETDAPYLPPVHFRGKRNESSYVKQVATFLAQVKETSLEEIAAVTSANAKSIFRLQ